MTEKTEPERFPCPGCKFSYVLVKADRKDAEPTVIRNHNSRTGPGRCTGSGRAPGLAPFVGDAADPSVPLETGTLNISQHGEDLTAAYSPQESADEPAVVTREETMAALEYVFTAPAPVVDTVPVVADGEADGRGDLVPDTALPVLGADGSQCSPGACTGYCGCPSGECPSALAPVVPDTALPVPVVDVFTAPAPMPAELPAVHGQPEPDRDRWGRYMIMGAPHTRVTTFVKSASSTFSLNQWQQRMVIAGLVQRRDLLALAHGLDVKRDRNTLNSIADQAKEAAGQKVAANLGTAYHAFSERLDAGLIGLQDIPPEYRGRMEQYSNTVQRSGLVTRPEWIERTTAVRADQVSGQMPVAGTLDRIFQLPNGELVIGDLKTGADLSYGWGEIAAQLAIYAHGVNTHGLFDWNTKTWDNHDSSYRPAIRELSVRTDFAIVIHLPAGGEGCTLYRVDIQKGWERAQVCGQVMTMQKSKDSLAHPVTVLEVNPSGVPSPPVKLQRPQGLNSVLSGGAVDQLRALPAAPKQAAFVDTGDPYALALHLISQAPTRERIAELYQFAADSGKFTGHGLADLVTAGMARVAELG